MATTGVLKTEDKEYAGYIQLSQFAGFLIPFGSIIAPVILLALKKDASDFVRSTFNEVINFQISITIIQIICILFSIILIGIPFLILFIILEIIWIIQAYNASNRGEIYRYPMTIRFIK